MKKIKLNLILSCLISVVAISCKKDDNSSSNTSNVSSIVTRGNWRITLYNDSGTDELYHSLRFQTVPLQVQKVGVR